MCEMINVFQALTITAIMIFQAWLVTKNKNDMAEEIRDIKELRDTLRYRLNGIDQQIESLTKYSHSLAKLEVEIERARYVNELHKNTNP